MKSIPSDKYANDKYGRGNYTRWLGIRIDEQRRLQGHTLQADMFDDKKQKKTNIKYMADISDYTKEDVLEWWREQAFDLQLPEYLGNCVFCVKKDIKKIALAIKEEPEMAERFIELIDSKTNKIKPSRPDSSILYRGFNSIQSIRDSFADISSEDIKKKMRFTKSDDANSCSESCEAMMPSHDFALEIQEEFNKQRGIQ
jgi:hypothetical protein